MRPNVYSKHGLLCVCALWAAPASAQVLLPPPQFDRPTGPVEIREVPYNRVHEECGGRKALGEWRTEGCAYTHMSPPLVIIPTQASVGRRKYECLLRHELAHVNGWSHNHPHSQGECK